MKSRLHILLAILVLALAGGAHATVYTASDSEPCILLTWNAPTGSDPAASYNVYRSLTNGGSYTQIVNGIVPTSYLDCTVSAEQTYYYVVTAVDTSSNESSFSNQATILVPFYDSLSARGAIILNPGDTIPTNTAASLQARFLIAHSDALATTSVLTTNFSGPDPMTENYDENMSGSFNGAVSGQATYSIALGDALPIADSLTFSTAIAPPVWLTVVSSVFPPQAQLVWRHSPSANVVSQNVRRAFSMDGPFNVIASVSSTTQFYSDLMVFPGQHYFYAVTAVGTSGESELSNKVSTVIPSGVAPPVSLIVTVRQGQPVLIWRHSATRGLTAENVYRGTQSGGPYSLIGQLSTIAQSYADLTAVSGTQYFYVVTDLSGFSESRFSNEVTLTIPTVP